VQLTKKRRNELFELLGSSGVNPIEFELTYIKAKNRLKHVPSASVFEFGAQSGAHSGWISVTWLVGNRIARSTQISTWSGLINLVHEWVTDEIAAPDLWVENRRQREFLSKSGYETVNNTPFTQEEQAEIAAQLREIREYVKKAVSLSAEQMSQVEARLDEAETAAQHIGRKDWLLLFMGVLFTLIISALLTPEVVQHIFGMAIHGLSHLFDGGYPPPPSPPSIT
jgi:hypothetical protein